MRWLACESRSGLDKNLHQTRRPAALESAATVAGIIVDGDVQHVVAGFAELDVRRRFSVKGRIVDPRWQLLNIGLCFVEGHYTRSSVFRPGEGHRRTWRR